jgi:predicted transcriptional regulator
MSSKDLAIDVIRKLPEEASLIEIARELEFVAGIREGANELDRGEFVTADEMKSRVVQRTRPTK